MILALLLTALTGCAGAAEEEDQQAGGAAISEGEPSAAPAARPCKPFQMEVGGGGTTITISRACTEEDIAHVVFQYFTKIASEEGTPKLVGFTFDTLGRSKDKEALDKKLLAMVSEGVPFETTRFLLETVVPAVIDSPPGRPQDLFAAHLLGR